MKDQSITPNHEVAVGGPACKIVISTVVIVLGHQD